MKRLFAFLIALSCCAASNVALADEITEDATPVNDAVVIEETVDVKDPNAVTVMVNGTELIADVPAQIMNDRTMLPMRAIFEKLGANVSWMEKRPGNICYQKHIVGCYASRKHGFTCK